MSGRPDADGGTPDVPAAPQPLDYRTPPTLPALTTRPPYGWLTLLAPPLLVAVLSWPARYFSPLVGTPTTLGAMIVGTVWAWDVGDRIAAWRYAAAVEAATEGARPQPSPASRTWMRAVLFAAQVVGMLATVPLFVLTLDFLWSMGVKVKVGNWP